MNSQALKKEISYSFLSSLVPVNLYSHLSFNRQSLLAPFAWTFAGLTWNAVLSCSAELIGHRGLKIEQKSLANHTGGRVCIIDAAAFSHLPHVWFWTGELVFGGVPLGSTLRPLAGRSEGRPKWWQPGGSCGVHLYTMHCNSRPWRNNLLNKSFIV